MCVQKYTKSLLPAAVCLLISAVLWMAGLSNADRELAERLGRQVLRFHVVADSNLKSDQELKLSVRTFLLNRIQEEAGEGSSKEEILSFLETEGGSLMEEASQFIQSNGGDYEARLEIGRSYFPTKVYGDMVFPAGTYDAVKVILGHGKGRNWWCVLYPSLCFIDETQAIVPDCSKTQLRAMVSDEDYRALLSVHPKIRFSLKITEWWDSLWENSSKP